MLHNRQSITPHMDYYFLDTLSNLSTYFLDYSIEKNSIGANKFSENCNLANNANSDQSYCQLTSLLYSKTQFPTFKYVASLRIKHRAV